MKILICLKEITDPALNLGFGPDNSIIFKEGRPRRLNPADAAAFSIALSLKSAGAEIIAVSIGEERVESYLRNALAAGADKAVRIWDEDFGELSPFQKALLLSGLAAVSRFDLILTGSRSPDTANGQVGPMLAAFLSLPCVSNAVGFEPDKNKNSIIITKDIGKGEREKLKCPLPAVITVKGEGKLPYASLNGLIASKSREIEIMAPSDLGVSPEALRKTAVITRLTFPRPPLTKAPPLDSSLPAFYRILQLLQGGIAKRKGHMLEGDAAQIAEQLFQLLLKEGVLKKPLSNSPFTKGRE